MSPAACDVLHFSKCQLRVQPHWQVALGILGYVLNAMPLLGSLVSHVTHMNESCHTYVLSHIIEVNESRRRYKWVLVHTRMRLVSCINESCLMYE